MRGARGWIACLLIIVTSSAAAQAPPAQNDPYQQGLRHLGKGRLDAAVASFGQVLAANPRRLEALINRGVAYHLKGQLRQALADASRAVTVDPASGLAFHNRAAVRQRLGDLIGAHADYTRALTMSPPNERFQMHRGVARQLIGNLDGARMDYELALHLQPTLVEALYNRGTLRQQRGDRGGAEADYVAARKAAGPTPPPPGTARVDPRVPPLIVKLGSAVWTERDAATRALIKIGAPAIAPLRAALKASKDLEVRQRARKILDAIVGRQTVGGWRRPAPALRQLAQQALAGLDAVPVVRRPPLTPLPWPADESRIRQVK